MAARIIHYGVDLARNYFTSAAVTAAVPTLITAIVWIARNQGHILQGATTVMAVKDCVLENKIRSQRDNCFNSFKFLQEHIRDLLNLNASDYNNNTKDALESIVKRINQGDFALQWFTDLNQRTQKVWEGFDKKTQTKMKEKGVVPNTFSLNNLPKSAADLALWLGETAEHVNKYHECEKNLIQSTQERDLAKSETSTCKDRIIHDKEMHKKETDPLIERKGECKNFETVVKEKEQCIQDKFSTEKLNINLQMEVNLLNEQLMILQKELDESKKWFFTRFIGL